MRLRTAAGAAFLALCSCTAAAPSSPIDSIVPPILEKERIPGAVILAGEGESVTYRRAFGTASLDTIFDLASCTKVVGTTTAALKLVEEGRLSLDDPLGKYVKCFEGREITLRELLLHRSHLPAYLKPKSSTPEEILCEFALLKPQKEETTYSCLNMISLGRVVEVATGMPLGEYLAKNVFGPLGMKDTGYRPDPSRCAPTTPEITGRVHDPLAGAYMTGDHQSGNAGLFSTGDDLSVFCRALLGGRILKPATVDLIFRPVPGVTLHRRGLGWDVFESRPWAPGVGHTGFTGTLLWIDPVKKRWLVLLSNRTFHGEKIDVRPLREAVLRVVNS
jgi:CubicO group peptidase (beta-lactamase class C family)